MYNSIASNKRKSWALIISFVLILGLLGYSFGQWYGDPTIGLIYAGAISLLMTLTGYFAGDRIALAASGARRIAKADAPPLYRAVENLAITAGLPLPQVYLIEDDSINAFATGRDPQHASVAVTTGAIRKLEDEELEGVLAHELSHIGNYDVRLMTLVVVLVGAISLLANLFWRAQWLGGRRSRDDHGGQAGSILMIVGLVFAILSPVIAELIKLAVSRRREFLADASGALLTRYPDGLARALLKIQADGQPLTGANAATAHLYFANPFGASGRFMVKLFSTHPPVDERVAALRQMGNVK